MNSRFIAALFVASLALAASMEVDEYNTDVAYAEATSFVQSYLEAQVFDGKKKDESACAKVADDSIEEIKDECKKLQGIVNSAATKNAHCCADSMGPVRKAVKRYNDSKSSGKKCRKELESLRNSSVSFSGVKFKNLKEGKCGHFFTGGSFASVHKKVKAKSLRCNQIDGQTKAFKREWDLAVDEACRGRSRCNARAKKAYTTAFNTAKKACSSAKNKKAWTRAKHMKCVLQGKTLAQCRTGSPPKIQSRAMTKRNCNCKCSGSSDVIVGSKPFRLRRSYVKSTSITTHRDFKLEFTIKPHGRVNGWNSVLHFSAGRGSNGSRIPAIWFHGGSTRMHVRMGRHGNANDGCDPNFQLPLHKWSHVTVKVVGHQLTVNVDGKRACYSNNYSGRHAYKSQRNVRLYLSDPWYPAANASIKNLYYGTGRFGGSSKRGACDGSVGKKAGGNKGGKKGETHKAWNKIPTNPKTKGLEGDSKFADALQSQGLCKVSDWTDSESICTSEVPKNIFADGKCRKGKSKNVGIWVTYKDGYDGYATYAGVQDKWCKRGFRDINPKHVGGMMKNCKGLHFLTDHSCKSLPMAWSGCKTKYSNNFDVDFRHQKCSDWRASKGGWGQVRIRLYCDCAAIGA